MSQSPSPFDVSSVNGVQQCDCWRHHFSSLACVRQSRAKVATGFTNLSSLTVTAFDLVYCSLSVLRFVFVLDISKQSS